MYKQKSLPRLLFFAPILFLLNTIGVSAQTAPFVPNCNGIDDTLEFTTLIDGAAGNPRTILIPYYDDLNKRCKVTTMTVPANITIDNTDGIGITLDSPNVLTVLGPIVNPVGKILFFGTGTTSFAGNSFVGANGQARLSNGAGVDTWGIPDGVVPATRSVDTAGPLSGGGDLTADRTIACPTCAVTTDSLSQFAPTTSSNLANMITDETGAGALVFADSPTFTGNVGIGTSSPPSILTVQTSGGDTVGEKYLRIRNTNSFTGLLLDPGQTGDVNWLLMGGYPNAGDFTVRQFGLANFLTIKKTTGNVGIGTATPDAKLHIFGASTNTNLAGFQFADSPLVLRNTRVTNNNFSLISVQDAAGFGNVVFGGLQTNQVAHSGEFLIMTRNSGAIQERLRVDRTGNLLLGTTASPTANAARVMVFGDNGTTDPTLATSTAGLFAKDMSGVTRLFAIDEDGTAKQLTSSESIANKSTSTSLGTSDILYPTQKAVKTYVDDLISAGGAFPSGNSGDLQMKSGAALTASAINDNGSVISFNRPVNLGQSANDFAQWIYNNDRSFSLAATLAPPTAPSASLLNDATGVCTAGTHQFKVTYVTPSGETNASPPSNVVTCSALQTKVTITLPTGSTVNSPNTIATARNIYATKAGGSTFFLIAPTPVVNNNTSTTYTFSLSDSSFGPAEPTVNSAVDNRIFVDNLGNVGIGTTNPIFNDDGVTGASVGKWLAVDGNMLGAAAYLGLGGSVPNVNDRVGALNFYNWAMGGVDHRTAHIMSYNDGALGNGTLEFSTSFGGAPLTRMVIKSSGEIGINRNAGVDTMLQIRGKSTNNTTATLSLSNSLDQIYLKAEDDGFVLFGPTPDVGIRRSSSRTLSIENTLGGNQPANLQLQGLQYRSGPRPTCDATTRGFTWFVAGGPGVSDSFSICRKDAADAYAWITLF